LWYGQVDMASGQRTATEFGALHAFLPGVLVLGGELERARRLEASCFRMWQLRPTHDSALPYTRVDYLRQPRYGARRSSSGVSQPTGLHHPDSTPHAEVLCGGTIGVERGRPVLVQCRRPRLTRQYLPARQLPDHPNARITDAEGASGPTMGLDMSA
jgi:hypothetical protein